MSRDGNDGLVVRCCSLISVEEEIDLRGYKKLVRTL